MSRGVIIGGKKRRFKKTHCQPNKNILIKICRRKRDRKRPGKRVGGKDSCFKKKEGNEKQTVKN